MIGFSAEYRRQAYEKIMDAVQRSCARARTAHAENKDAVQQAAPKDKTHDTTELAGLFRSAVTTKFPSGVKSAWEAFDKLTPPRGQLSRTGELRSVYMMICMLNSFSQISKRFW